MVSTINPMVERRNSLYFNRVLMLWGKTQMNNHSTTILMCVTKGNCRTLTEGANWVGVGPSRGQRKLLEDVSV